ncbi:MAG: sugar phosphate isomerase/epimerase family protein [Spirochaetia bacterium]|jgi:sugar phosphate isomerase/epimerase|nr:sugar phosphate isomerase/epimerase family protein [Spirochaetia bacterium]
MFRFGLRAHDFGPCETGVLADRIASYGALCVQLALSKALPGFPASPGHLSQERARGIREIFTARGIGIAVLGCYINPIHPDAEKRELQLRRFEEHLCFARDFGCSLVGTETGSLNPDSSWHQDTDKAAAFDALCDSAARLARTAERYGSIVAIEPVADQHVVSSIEKTKILLDRIDSPALGIIFDPVNLIPQNGLKESQAAFFRRAFEAFGSRIVAVHLKDFRLEQGRKSKIVAPAEGSGEFDFSGFFSLLKQEKPGIDVIVENTSSTTAPEALKFLGRLAAEA